MVVCGSSVASGWHTAYDHGWAWLLAEQLQSRYQHQSLRLGWGGWAGWGGEVGWGGWGGWGGGVGWVGGGEVGRWGGVGWVGGWGGEVGWVGWVGRWVCEWVASYWWSKVRSGKVSSFLRSTAS